MCKTPLKNIRRKEKGQKKQITCKQWSHWSSRAVSQMGVADPIRYLQNIWQRGHFLLGQMVGKGNRPLKIAFPEFTDQWLSHGSRHSILLFVFVQWLIRRICKIVVLALKSLKIFSLTLENFQSLILPSFRCFFSLSCFENSNFFLKRNFPKIVL